VGGWRRGHGWNGFGVFVISARALLMLGFFPLRRVSGQWSVDPLEVVVQFYVQNVDLYLYILYTYAWKDVFNIYIYIYIYIYIHCLHKPVTVV
jgi:hypothetical protein